MVSPLVDVVYAEEESRVMAADVEVRVVASERWGVTPACHGR